MTDQHAERVLGAAGDMAADTPSLDRLASRGVRFSNCYCPSPLCVPSRMAFLSGLEPHQSGVLSNDDFLPSDIPTVAHALGAAGYDCRLVGRMHFYGPDQLHGFAERPIGDIGPGWPGAGPPEIGPLTTARGNRGDEVAGSGVGETSYQAYDMAVTAAAVEALDQVTGAREAGGAPFFLVASLFCPHPPYIALPEDYHAVERKVQPPRLSVPIERHPALDEWARAGGVERIDQGATERARTAYYGLVRMVDRLAGEIIATVEDRDDTIVVYVSDHGEALGERGLWWKSTFYDESAKVPVIMAGPGIAKDTVDARIMSLLDLSATLLDLGGAPALPGQVGRSIAQDGQWEHRALSSYYGGLMNIRTGALRHRMLRRDDLKLCVFDGHAPQLFDLSMDPDELDNIALEKTDLVSDLMVDLVDGWNSTEIAQSQYVNGRRTSLIRDWVQAVRPEERLRWRDPSPQRNRYL